MPNVTVVIPAHNAERFLGPAIDSVIAQTYSIAQIVVVDDGSKDRTAAIAGTFGPRVLCISQPNAGVAAARNRGAAAAATEWIAFLDADDLWRPEKIERQLREAEARRADVVFCGLELMDAEGHSLGYERRATSLGIEPLLLHDQEIPQGTSSTILVRSAIFEEIGRYDEALATMADWDLLIRLRLRTTFATVDEPLALYRRHAGTMSRSVALLERESQLVIEKTFSRPDLRPEWRQYKKQCVAWNDLVLSGCHYHAGNLIAALRFGCRAALLNPRLAPRILGFPFRGIAKRLAARSRSSPS